MRLPLNPFASAAVTSLVLSATVVAGVAEARWSPRPTAEPLPPCVGPVLPGTPALCLDDPTSSGRSDTVAYDGLGTWLDAYDWAPEYGGRVRPSSLDTMREQGIKTIYLQAAKVGTRSQGALLSPSLLAQWLEGAHARGMRVQAWYLPLLSDVARDNASLDAIVDFRANGHAFDTIGLDIEWRGVTPVAERNRRLVEMSERLRAKVPSMPLSAIVVAPVVTNDVNRDFWNPFPWAELEPLYDVWQPMGYWTDRKSTSRWRDAQESTEWNIRFLRENLRDPEAKVHAIGGIAPTRTEVRGFVTATQEQGSLGGSIYDYPHTSPDLYGDLQGVPRQR